MRAVSCLRRLVAFGVPCQVQGLEPYGRVEYSSEKVGRRLRGCIYDSLC